jgi:hypothetical protein
VALCPAFPTEDHSGGEALFGAPMPVVLISKLELCGPRWGIRHFLQRLEQLCLFSLGPEASDDRVELPFVSPCLESYEANTVS